MADDLDIAPGVVIGEDEIAITAVRASGPGGQHVNKTSSAVVLRFDVAGSSLPERYKEGVLRLGDGRVSREGVVVIKAQRHRSQERNRADALERLRDLLQRAGRRERPRVPTRPSKGARRARVDDKKRRGRTKSLRRTPDEAD